MFTAGAARALGQPGPAPRVGGSALSGVGAGSLPWLPSLFLSGRSAWQRVCMQPGSPVTVSLLRPACLPSPAFRFSQGPLLRTGLISPLSLSVCLCISVSSSVSLPVSVSLPLSVSLLSLSSSFSLLSQSFFSFSLTLPGGRKQHMPCRLHENRDAVGAVCTHSTG